MPGARQRRGAGVFTPILPGYFEEACGPIRTCGGAGLSPAIRVVFCREAGHQRERPVLDRLLEPGVKKEPGEVPACGHHALPPVDHSIRSASRSGSMTPFRSLPWSKPCSDSARMVTFTLPARSARLAIAFQATKS